MSSGLNNDVYSSVTDGNREYIILGTTGVGPPRKAKVSVGKLVCFVSKQ